MVRKFLVGAAGGGAALALIFGATANANPYDAYAGLTFAQVQERNGNAKIGTRVGEYLPTEECIVTGSRKINGTLLVDLNCNDPKSAGGDGNDHAGNSVMSPAGKKIAALKEKAVALSSNYEKEVAAGKPLSCEKYYDYCVRVCEQAGVCSAELSEYLGL